MTMIIEQRKCKQTGKMFDITQHELDVLEKASPLIAGKRYLIPTSHYHPDVHKQRHLAWRNERTLYRSTCDLTGKPIITSINPKSGYKIINFRDRYGDKLLPLSYGQEINLSKTFTEQFGEILSHIPQISLDLTPSMENCDYCNYGMDSKNCYVCQTAIWSENCLYSSLPMRCYHDVDGYANTDGQYTYECCYTMNCYECQHVYYSRDCKKSRFLLDCSDCENCIACVNMSHAKYCIFNTPYTKEEYLTERERLAQQPIANLCQQFKSFSLRYPRRATRWSNAENSSGDMNYNVKDCHESYDMQDAKQMTYCRSCGVLSNDFDRCTIAGVSNTIYDSMGVAYGESSAFNSWSYLYQCYYTYNCRNCDYCFWCIGLTYKKYCILNKQYTKQEYETILPQLIAHMEETGEWWEFFHPSISLFPYNDTCAYERFPERKEDILTRWRKRIDHDYTIWSDDGYEPKDITIYKNDPQEYEKLLSSPIICRETRRPFKIIKQELDFYCKFSIPIPRHHPDIRYRQRCAQRSNPRKLFKRTCAKTWVDILTPYSLDTPDIVRSESARDREFLW